MIIRLSTFQAKAATSDNSPKMPDETTNAILRPYRSLTKPNPMAPMICPR
jgi:hypothetical protein